MMRIEGAGELDSAHDFVAQHGSQSPVFALEEAVVKAHVVRSQYRPEQKRKGRDQLVNKGGYNSHRSQAKATLDNVIICERIAFAIRSVYPAIPKQARAGR